MPLGLALQDEDLRRDIESLRPDGLSKEVPLLRVLDVAVWMSFR